jgi:hypothetical protein
MTGLIKMSETQASAGQPRSVHDNVLVSYVVECSEKRILVHTVFERRDPFEHTDIVFEDVIAYRHTRK